MKIQLSTSELVLAGAGLLGASLLVWASLLAVRHQDVVFSYRAGQAAEQFYRETLLGPQRTLNLPVEVQGFAVYDAQGSYLRGQGMVPKKLTHIDLHLMGPEGRLTRLGPDTWELIRQARPDLPLMRSRMGAMMGRPTELDRSGVFLYLRVRDPDLPGSTWGTWTLVGLALLGWIALFIGLWWLVRRNQAYQDALTHNRELANYAAAGKTLSHEIKNPLASIVLHTAVIKKQVVWPEGIVHPSLSIIEHEAHRIGRLVERVRDFMGNPRGQVEAFSISAVLQAIGERLGLSLSRDKDDLWVAMDKDRCTSIVENLIVNAREANPGAQPLISLARIEDHGRPWVQFSVEDEGPGFSKEALDHLGTPFFTTKTAGMGMGLALARSFVEAAGGKLVVQNLLGRGARVSMVLPMIEGRSA